VTALVDEASDVVTAFIAAMKAAFNPADAIQPPLGGGSAEVHFLAGEVVAFSLWDSFAIGNDCGEPFLWVRLIKRYRSKVFPTETLDTEACALPRVVAVEIGVARCATVGNADATTDWAAVQQEAEFSLDDSWRIEMALCDARRRLQNHAVAVSTITPNGPDGGVVAWAATAFVQL